MIHRSVHDHPAAPSATHVRLSAGVVLAGCLGVLLVAGFLRPSEQGYGTHRSMGLPPCGLLASTHVPCPTCGMTTAFAHAAAGDLRGAFVAQPAGAMLAVITAMAALLAGWAVATACPIGFHLRGLINARVMWLGGAVLLVAWVYKIVDVRGFIG